MSETEPSAKVNHAEMEGIMALVGPAPQRWRYDLPQDNVITIKCPPESEWSTTEFFLVRSLMRMRGWEMEGDYLVRRKRRA